MTCNIIVIGFKECYYFQQAKKLGRKLKKEGKITKCTTKSVSRDEFFKEFNSSPAVYKNGKKLSDGYTSLTKIK